jgi:hypothetical protein
MYSIQVYISSHSDFLNNVFVRFFIQIYRAIYSNISPSETKVNEKRFQNVVLTKLLTTWLTHLNESSN